MKKQIIRGYVIAASAGVVVALFLVMVLMYQIYWRSLQDRLQSNLIVFSSQVNVVAVEPEDLELELRSLTRQLNAVDQDLRFTVIRADGTIVADSDPAAGTIGDTRSDRPEIIAAREGKWIFDLRDSDTSEHRYLYTAKQEGEYIFRAALPADEYGFLFRALTISGLFCLFAGISSAVLLGRRMAVRLTKPVESLTAASQAIADGDFDQRVGAYPDELGVLGQSFNLMAAHLEKATTGLKQHNEELHSIISGIQDGIIAVQGNEMQPFLLTEQAVEMLGPYSQDYGSLEMYGSNYSKLSQIAKRAIASREAITDVIELSYPRESILNVYAAPFGSETGSDCVIVLHDVTRVTKLEQLRTEFVANVTHELKTPLTSIRGYIQLLKGKERDEETRNSFYEIIEIETERLVILISDLLDLSEIESRNRHQTESRSKLQSCLLYEVAAEVKEQTEPIAQERDVTVEIDMPWDLEVGADYKRMKQLLSNLVSNAIFYNRKGGTVWMQAKLERDMVAIRVRDNGIGISPEHRERIFERFYRVSKDRSRELGGTGLGLSIVKHIVNLYEGSISLESEVGEGTVFLIRLPLPRQALLTEDINDL